MTSVCHHCPERLPEKACEKTCQRRQQEMQAWAEQKRQRVIAQAGNYYSHNAENAIRKRQKGH